MDERSFQNKVGLVVIYQVSRYLEYYTETMIGISSACRFMVTDLPGAFDFRVTLIFSICLEDGSTYEQEVVLLNNALLPRQSCDFNIGTPITSKNITFFDL